jgi:lysozyme
MRFEGTSLTPYQDQKGIWTIATGAIVDLAGNAVTADTPPITAAVAQSLLERDLASAAAAVIQALYVDVSPLGAGGWISLAFNIGNRGMAGSDALRLFNGGDTARACAAFANWDHITVDGVLKPDLGLRRRRWTEAAMVAGRDLDSAYGAAWALIDTVTAWPSFDVVLPST